MKEKKGFTLAELLVVVAIIGVLVAVSIPIFTGQLEKSRDAVTVANLRSAYAEAQTAYMTESPQTAGGHVVYAPGAKAGTATVKVTNVVAKGKKVNTPKFSGLAEDLPFTAPCDLDDKSGTYTITFNYGENGNITTLDIEKTK